MVATIDAAAARVTSVYDAAGRRTAVVDPLGNRTTSVYDAAGREIETIDPLGQSATFAYDAVGRLESNFDRLGRKRGFSYDDDGNLLVETWYSLACISNVDQLLTYTYDSAGNQLTAITEGHTYDRRVISFSEVPDTGIWSFSINGSFSANMYPNATASEVYSAIATLATNSLGGWGVVGTVSVSGSMATGFEILFTDSFLGEITDDHGLSSTFTYDGVGQRTGVADAFGGIETSIYDAEGRLTRRTYSKPVSGAPDAVSRTDYTYSALNEQISKVNYAGTAGSNLVSRTTTTYDAGHRVSRLLTTNSTTTIADFQYVHDAHGRLTIKPDDGVVTTYAYDTTDQLTGEDFASGTDGVYTYDDNGNRTMSGYEIDADNRLASDGIWDYTYDAEGNRSEKDAVSGSLKWLYYYDHRNHLIRADRKTDGTTIDLTVEYTYDAWGNRVSNSVDSDGPGIANPDVTFFALDGWNPARGVPIGTENFDVWAELAIDRSLKTRYAHGDRVDEILARVDATGSHPGSYWYLTDQIGSIRKAVDNNGVVKDAITYDAYGNITAETDASYRGHYAWTGREIETETGLQFNRARYYDPAIGQWISKDPMGFGAGDSNLFRYAANSPLANTDASGQRVVIWAFEGTAGHQKDRNLNEGNDVLFGLAFCCLGPLATFSFSSTYSRGNDDLQEKDFKKDADTNYETARVTTSLNIQLNRDSTYDLAFNFEAVFTGDSATGRSQLATQRADKWWKLEPNQGAEAFPRPRARYVVRRSNVFDSRFRCPAR